MPETAKVYTLKGDPKNPESAENIIIFPGGSISVCRTSNNEYWAHISVNKGIPGSDSIRESRTGVIVDTRCDYELPRRDISSVPHEKELQHVAVRIKTE